LRYFLLSFFLIFVFIFPSSGVLNKFLGIYGILFYCVFILIFFYFFFISPHLKSYNFSSLHIHIASFISVMILFVLFLFIYPIANNHMYFGGSDSDNALNIAVHDLLKLQYPYYTKTYLGNAITPMPGSLILAVPFVLLGTSAYQNFFWIFLFFLFLIKYLKDRRSASYLFLILFFLVPLLPYHIFTGSDYIANSIYVLLLLYMFYYSIENSKKKIFSLLAAFIFGLALSSRPIYLLLLPVIFALLFRKCQFTDTLIYVGCIIFGFLLITLPFYLYDTVNFSPLHNIDKLTVFNDILPHTEIIVPLFSITAGLALIMLSKHNLDFDFLIISCSIVLIIPVLSGFLLASVQAGLINYRYTFYSSYFLFFVVVPLWNKIFSLTFHADTTDRRR